MAGRQRKSVEPAVVAPSRQGLEELRIRGLGVIDDAVLPLGPGLTVVTGETGAGKTMVVTGLLLLFGGRADPARVRTGVEQASVEGRLLLDPASPAAVRARDGGAELDQSDTGGAELVLRRVLNATGRSRAYVGGAGAPVATLTELAEHLVAVHGQSDQLRLVRPAAQRSALDAYGAVDHGPYRAAFAAWRAASDALDERTRRAAELRRESDLLAHGIAEIEAVGPEPGELQELIRVSARLGQADALTAAARVAHDALLGDAGDPVSERSDVGQLLAAAARDLAAQHGIDPDLDALGVRLAELGSLTADLGAEFGAYTDGLDTDPARLEQIEVRRSALTSLLRKYGDDPEAGLDGVLRWSDAARARLAEIDVSDEAIAALRSRVEDTAGEAAHQAATMSARRRTAAQQLGAAVTAELGGLAMPDARVRVDVRPRPPIDPILLVDGVEVGATADGTDEIELLLAPHPGAPELPIARGASGGELSRVMLALEVCMVASADGGTGDVPTLVFDEVDAGVGGRAAVEVGRRLARLARDRQVLVVTHLAQVAAFADRHVVVDKPAGRGKAAVTASDVRVVVDDDRVAELARMLAGSDTATAREHAAELLATAESS